MAYNDVKTKSRKKAVYTQAGVGCLMENKHGGVFDRYLPDLSYKKVTPSALHCVAKQMISGQIQDVISYKVTKMPLIELHQQ